MLSEYFEYYVEFRTGRLDIRKNGKSEVIEGGNYRSELPLRVGESFDVFLGEGLPKKYVIKEVTHKISLDGHTGPFRISKRDISYVLADANDRDENALKLWSGK